MNSHVISVLERNAVIAAIQQALAEVEQLEDISQGVVDDLQDAIRILGGVVHADQD